MLVPVPPAQADAGDSIVTRALWSIIASLVALCAWLFRRAKLEQEDAGISNGQKISRQEYIQILEARCERFLSAQNNNAQDLASQAEQLKQLEDITSASAQSIREVKASIHRMTGDQRIMNGELAAIRERLEKLPARG